MMPTQLVTGTALTTSATPYYVVPMADQRVKLVRLTSVRFVNLSSSACAVSLYIVPPGDPVADQYARFKGLVVPPASLGEPPQFFIMDDVMAPGTRLIATAETDGSVMFSASGELHP